LKVGYSGAFVSYFLLTGRWDWVSYYLRFVLMAALIVAAAAGYRRTRRLPWFVGDRRRSWSMAGWALLLLITSGLLVSVVRGFGYPEPAVSLNLPLRDGVFYIAHGGSTRLLNYHHTNRAQRFAVDVTQLNALGARASRIYSKNLERYVIYGARVHSPCTGTVIEAVDGLPDLIPPDTDRERPAGNRVVIACRGVRVALAHLQKGSVNVSPGTRVEPGRVLGLVGNSGNTSEPHLHVHAVAESSDAARSEGVPIVFDGTFATRNTVLRR
jgi:Peptidase family M23